MLIVCSEIAGACQRRGRIRYAVELPRADRWQSMARASIREDLYAAHSALTADVLAVGNGTSTPEQRFKAWEEKNSAILGRARVTLEEIQGSDSFDLASLAPQGVGVDHVQGYHFGHPKELADSAQDAATPLAAGQQA